MIQPKKRDNTILRNIYSFLKEKDPGNIPNNYEKFEEGMQNPEINKKVHQGLMDFKAEVPQDYNTFVDKIGLKKKVLLANLEVDSPEDGASFSGERIASKNFDRSAEVDLLDYPGDPFALNEAEHPLNPQRDQKLIAEYQAKFNFNPLEVENPPSREAAIEELIGLGVDIPTIEGFEADRKNRLREANAMIAGHAYKDPESFLNKTTEELQFQFKETGADPREMLGLISTAKKSAETSRMATAMKNLEGLTDNAANMFLKKYDETLEQLVGTGVNTETAQRAMGVYLRNELTEGGLWRQEKELSRIKKEIFTELETNPYYDNMTEEDKADHAGLRYARQMTMIGRKYLSDDEKKISEHVSELQKLMDAPATEEVLQKIDLLQDQIGLLKDNPKQLYDYKSDKFVSREEATPDMLETFEVVNKLAQNHEDTDVDKLIRQRDEAYWRWYHLRSEGFLYQAHGKTDEDLYGEEGLFGPKGREETRYYNAFPSDRFIDTHKEVMYEYLALNRALQLNEDMAGVERGVGNFFKRAGESIIEAFPGVDAGFTDKEFIDNYLSAAQQEGLFVSDAQEERFERTVSEDVAEMVGPTLRIGVEIALASTGVNAAGVALSSTKYVRALSKMVTGRYGKAGKYVQTLFTETGKGALTFGMTEETWATGAGEGFAQGWLKNFGVEKLLRTGKLGKLAGFFFKTGVGTSVETIQEFSGAYIEALNKEGVEDAFEEAFGHNLSEFRHKLAVIGMTSSLFSGSYNLATLRTIKPHLDNPEYDGDVAVEEARKMVDDALMDAPEQTEVPEPLDINPQVSPVEGVIDTERPVNAEVASIEPIQPTEIDTDAPTPEIQEPVEGSPQVTEPEIEQPVSGPVDATIEQPVEITTEEPGVEPEVEDRKVGNIMLAGLDKGFVQQQINDLAPNTRRFIKKQFTLGGLLPKSVVKLSQSMDGRIAARNFEAQTTLKDFESTLKNEYGRGFRNFMKNDPEGQKVTQALDNVLKGVETDVEIPEAVREKVMELRGGINALSAELQAQGLLQGDVELRVDGELQEYVTRSYKVHDAPKQHRTWLEKNPDGQKVRNKAVRLIRSEVLARTDGEPDMVAVDLEVEGIINDILDSEDGPVGMMNGKLGSKDLGILRERKDIAPEIRALMGEYNDPTLNYARSVSRMANLIEKHNFLTEVRKDGEGVYLFDKRQGEFSRQIASEGSEALSPLNGLHTTPEIDDAFKEMDAKQENQPWLRYYMAMNGFVKYSKTVLSPVTHMRNLVGNIGFAVINGHWKMKHLPASAKGVIGRLAKTTNEELAADIKEMIELGVLDESANAGELRDLINDINGKKDNVDQLVDSYVVRLKNKVGKAATNMYQAEDNFFKVFAYKNELSRYEKAWGNTRTPEEIKTKAAENVRRTYPTYSNIIPAIKSIRRFPLIGSFVSFPAEVIRTSVETGRLALEEVQDVSTRKIGITRMAGMAASYLGTGGLVLMGRTLAGLSSEDDDDLRNFMAPWDQNGNLYYTKPVEDGKFQYINISSVDPHGYVKGIVHAIYRGEDPGDAGLKALEQIFDPFIGEEILAEKIREVASNKKDNGQQVYNEQDDVSEQFKAQVSHIYKALEPGASTSIKRIWKGMYGEENQYGKKYDAVDELIAMASGIRVVNGDIKQSYTFRVFRAKKDLIEAKQIYSRVAKRQGPKSEDELNESYERANRILKGKYNDLKSLYDAAVRQQVQPGELIRIMKSGGFSKKDIYMVTSGQYIDLLK